MVRQPGRAAPYFESVEVFRWDNINILYVFAEMTGRKPNVLHRLLMCRNRE
jgi:hypothetical protein